MKSFNFISWAFLLALPILNFVIVFATVKIDNWFLLNPSYPLIFGILLPVILLTSYWSFAKRAVATPWKRILPWVITVMIALCGFAQVVVVAAASASV